MNLSMTDLEAVQTPDQLVTLQGEVATRMRDLDTEIGASAMTPEQRTEFETLSDMQDEVGLRLREIEARRARLEKASAIPAGVTTVGHAPLRTTKPKARRVPDDIYALGEYRKLTDTDAELEQAYRDGAMYAIERAVYPHPDSKAATEQEHLQRLVDTVDKPTARNPNRELSRRIIATGSPAYERAFTKYMLGQPLTPTDLHAAAPLTVQTDATGGYAVPFSFDPTLLHIGAWTSTNPYRRACTVKTIVGTDTYHGVTSGAAVVTRAAEAAAVAEGGPAIGQISAIVGKVHGGVTISNELLQDRPDIVSEMASLIAEAKDTEEESSFTLGVGDALGQGFNPIGMLCATTTTGGYTEIETAANNTLAIGDVYAMEAGLPIRHRANAAWFMGRATIRAIQALETTGGQLFGGQNYASVGYPQVDPFGNTGLRLLNYPIWEVPSAPTGVTDSYIVAALANPGTFYVVERAGMTVEVVPHIVADATGSRPTGQRMVYAWWRNTAKPAFVDGGRRLRINPA